MKCLFVYLQLPCLNVLNNHILPYIYYIDIFFILFIFTQYIYNLHFIPIHPHKLPTCNLLMVTFPTNHIAQKHILNNYFKYADIAIDV